MLTQHTSPHPRFHFANIEMTEIFLFQVFKELAFGLVSIFVPIYLLTSGVSLFHIILIFTIRSAFHAIVALLFSRIVLFKIGIKHTFIITTVLYIASFVVIKQGVSIGWVSVWALLTATANALYSSAQHSFLSLKVDEGAAGRQVAIFAIIAMAIGILTPLVGAFMILLFGFKHMLVVGSGFLVLSVIPLFFSKEIDTSNQVHLKGVTHIKTFWKEKRAIAISTMGNGINGASAPLWDSLYIYKLVGGLKMLGAINSVVSFVQMITQYIGGKRVDQKKSGFQLGISGSIFARTLTLISFHPYIAMMSETVDGVVRPLFSTAYSATFYKSLRGPHTISYITAHETVWHAANVWAMTFVCIATYFFGWYAFLVAGFFMVLGNMIVRTQGVGRNTQIN